MNESKDVSQFFCAVKKFNCCMNFSFLRILNLIILNKGFLNQKTPMTIIKVIKYIKHDPNRFHYSIRTRKKFSFSSVDSLNFQKYDLQVAFYQRNWALYILCSFYYPLILGSHKHFLISL